MKIVKVFLAKIHDPEDSRWDGQMYVVFCDRDCPDVCEDIPDVNRKLAPYGIDDDDVHFYFDKEDFRPNNKKLIDGNDFEITLLEEIQPEY